MELGNVAAASPVLDDVLECRDVPLSLLDPSGHGRDGCRPLGAVSRRERRGRREDVSLRETGILRALSARYSVFSRGVTVETRFVDAGYPAASLLPPRDRRTP